MPTIRGCQYKSNANQAIRFFESNRNEWANNKSQNLKRNDVK